MNPDLRLNHLDSVPSCTKTWSLVSCETADRTIIALLCSTQCTGRFWVRSSWGRWLCGHSDPRSGELWGRPRSAWVWLSPGLVTCAVSSPPSAGVCFLWGDSLRTSEREDLSIYEKCFHCRALPFLFSGSGFSFVTSLRYRLQTQNKCRFSARAEWHHCLYQSQTVASHEVCQSPTWGGVIRLAVCSRITVSGCEQFLTTYTSFPELLEYFRPLCYGKENTSLTIFLKLLSDGVSDLIGFRSPMILILTKYPILCR